MDDQSSGVRSVVGATSALFAVDAVPGGFRLVAAGTGRSVADWGSDSFGTHEPFAVLSPDGTAPSPDVVVVSITGFEGYQGGLAQVARGYLADEREDVEIDGRPGIYSPNVTMAGSEQWADLVVEVEGGVWAAVAFVDGPGTAVCPGAGVPPPSMVVMTVEALDAMGAVIGCLGAGGLADSHG